MSLDELYPTLLVFHAPYSGPCNAFIPIAKEAVRIALGHVDIEFIDVTDEQNAQDVAKYRIEGAPTTVMLSKHGGELERVAGYNTLETITNIIRRALT